MEYNVYCDESCHLENSVDKIMVLGAVYCPKSERKEICKRIADLKARYNVKPSTELKWTKISDKKINLYRELLEFFFHEESLYFRCVVADKSKLNHSRYHQSHDDWYYKMYYLTLNYIFNSSSQFNVYLDIKDSLSTEKIKHLHDIICNANYDFSHTVIKNMQPIRSDEVQIMQLTDILIGAIQYINNNKFSSNPKLKLIDYIKKETGKSLITSSYVSDKKFNIFIWEPDFYE